LPFDQPTVLGVKALISMSEKKIKHQNGNADITQVMKGINTYRPISKSKMNRKNKLSHKEPVKVKDFNASIQFNLTERRNT
jgi:hypothetical protein